MHRPCGTHACLTSHLAPAFARVMPGLLQRSLLPWLMSFARLPTFLRVGTRDPFSLPSSLTHSAPPPLQPPLQSPLHSPIHHACTTLATWHPPPPVKPPPPAQEPSSCNPHLEALCSPMLHPSPPRNPHPVPPPSHDVPPSCPHPTPHPLPPKWFSPIFGVFLPPKPTAHSTLPSLLFQSYTLLFFSALSFFSFFLPLCCSDSLFHTHSAFLPRVTNHR